MAIRRKPPPPDFRVIPPYPSQAVLDDLYQRALGPDLQTYQPPNPSLQPVQVRADHLNERAHNAFYQRTATVWDGGLTVWDDGATKWDNS